MTRRQSWYRFFRGGLLLTLISLAILSCSRQEAVLVRLASPGVVSLEGSFEKGISGSHNGEWAFTTWQTNAAGDAEDSSVLQAEGWFKGDEGYCLRGVEFHPPGLGIENRSIEVTFILNGKQGRREIVKTYGELNGHLALWEPVEVGNNVGKWRISTPCPSSWRGSPQLKARALWVSIGRPKVGRLVAGSEGRPGVFLTSGTRAVCVLRESTSWKLCVGLALGSGSEPASTVDVLVHGTGSPERVASLRIDRETWADTVVNVQTAEADNKLELRCVEGSVLIGSPTLVSRQGTRKKPNILLISLDTVRGDHLDLSVLGEFPEALTELVSRSVVFDRAVAQSSVTDASHHSIMSGLCVPRHGGKGKRRPFDTVRTVAEILAENGYFTAGFTDGGLVSAAYGFDRGFDRYWEYGGSPHDKQHFPWILARCKRWLVEDKADSPWFCFVHTYQAHSPYTNHELDHAPVIIARPKMVPAEWEEMSDQLRALDVIETPKPGVLLMLGKQNYKSEVRYLGKTINQFVKWLDTHGKLENTMVILLSDHGEGFFEHNLVGHNNSLYEELIHVPLIIRFPKDKFEGRRIQTPVRTVDLLPTILECAGIPEPIDVDGISLVPYCDTGAMPVVPALSSHYLCHAVISWPYKLILSRRAKQSALFNLSVDPGETDNVLYEATTGLIDSLAQPILNMVKAGAASYIISIARPETSCDTLVLTGEAMKEAEIWFWDTDDMVLVEPRRLTICLGASVFNRMVVIHPFAALPHAGVTGGELRMLIEGTTHVGGYELVVERLKGAQSQRLVKEDDRLKSQLEALGYVE